MERVTAWSMDKWDTALEKAEYALKNLGEMAWKCQVGRGSKIGSRREQNPLPSAGWTDSPAHLPPGYHTATPGNKCFSLHPTLTWSSGVPLMEWLCNNRAKPPAHSVGIRSSSLVPSCLPLREAINNFACMGRFTRKTRKTKRIDGNEFRRRRKKVWQKVMRHRGPTPDSKGKTEKRKW